MATDLRDRLGDLAAHAPPGSPPADLWRRGVRRRRLARAGAAGMVVALVALLGVGGWSWRLDHTRVEPVAPQGSPTLPNQFFTPSPWLGAFDGAPGPLITVIPAEQKAMLDSRQGLVGVTAVGNIYGFLDLPDDAVLDGNLTSAFALSPDGRRLAFWLSGPPRGSANTVLEGTTVTGLGTYDTVTGRVRTHHVPTVHGLSPSLLLWADDDTLSFAYNQIQGGDRSGEASGGSHYVGRGVWEAAAAAPQMLPGGQRPLFLDNSTTRGAGGSLVGPAPHGPNWWLMSADDGRDHVSFRTRPVSPLLVPNRSLTRVAAVLRGSHSNVGPLAVGALPSTDAPAAKEVRLRTVNPGLRGWFRPLAWVDDHRLAALGQIVVNGADGTPHVAGEIQLVNLRRGDTRILVERTPANGTEGWDAWLATDLLGAPSVNATPPPDPRDRRAVALGLLIASVLLGLAGWRLRGRRA